MYEQDLTKDILFLSELKTHIELGSNGDPTHTEYAIKMVDDWLNELKEAKKNES